MSYRKYFSALVETNRTLGLELRGCFCLFLICVKPQEQNLQTSQLFPFFFFFFSPFKPLRCWQQPAGRRSRSVPCGASWVCGALIGAKKCFLRHPGGEMCPWNQIFSCLPSFVARAEGTLVMLFTFYNKIAPCRCKFFKKYTLCIPFLGSVMLGISAHDSLADVATCGWSNAGVLLYGVSWWGCSGGLNWVLFQLGFI